MNKDPVKGMAAAWKRRNPRKPRAVRRAEGNYGKQRFTYGIKRRTRTGTPDHLKSTEDKPTE